MKIIDGYEQLNKLFNKLPKCSGKWIKGSGGYRLHEKPICDNYATYYHLEDPYSYCDEHMTPYDKDFLKEVSWAASLRNKNLIQALDEYIVYLERLTETIEEIK